MRKEWINMNIIRMTGGLGNQMFQYALFLRLKAQGKEVKFDDRTEYKGEGARPILLWAFGIDYPAAGEEEVNELTDGFMKFSHRLRRKLFGRKSKEYREKSCNFDQQILEREPAYFTGYFQSERYFEEVKEQVRKAFQFSGKIWGSISKELEERIREYQTKIENKSQMPVSVHIRRGDYLENDEAYGGICTDAYYRKAIEMMEEKFPNTVFYIFSNDTGWAKQWIDHFYREKSRFIVIEGTTEDTGYLDLFLMSKCRAHIIANSSFSWWGAWLDSDQEKIVIAPSKWVNHQDMKDIYTREMIKISPKGEVR